MFNEKVEEGIFRSTDPILQGSNLFERALVSLALINALMDYKHLKWPSDQCVVYLVPSSGELYISNKQPKLS